MKKNSPSAVLTGMRPPTLLLGLGPVVIGGSLAFASDGAKADTWYLLLSLLFVCFMQGAANLINDVKDAETGVDTEQRIGPLRVVQAGLVDINLARVVYQTLLIGGFVLGAILTIRGGTVVLALAAASALAAYLYTGGPKPLSHLALGEMTALVFFGPVAVLGTAYLVSGSWTEFGFYWSIGPGLLAATVMAINNVRDLATDRLTTKLTLPMLFPQETAHLIPKIFLGSSVIMYLLLALSSENYLLGAGSFAILALIAWKFLWPVYDPKKSEMNTALKQTSIYCFFYCLASSLVILW